MALMHYSMALNRFSLFNVIIHYSMALLFNIPADACLIASRRHLIRNRTHTGIASLVLERLGSNQIHTT